MSITKNVKIKGYPTKRRKLSHEYSDEDSYSESSNASLDGDGNGKQVTSERRVSNGQSSDFSNGEIKSTSKGVAARNTGGRSANVAIAPMSTTSRSGSSSNMLQFQVQQLVSEVRPDYNLLIKQSQPNTDKVVNIIKAIQPLEAMSFTQAQSYSRKHLRVAIPWGRQPTANLKYTLSYQPPSKITVDGPVIRRLSTKGVQRIFIVPEMPADMFQDKDYLNCRAIHKRAFYLACIASAVNNQMGKVAKVQFVNLEGNEYIPILNITCETAGKPYIYEICPSFPPSLGSVPKMKPSRNSLRKDELADDSMREKSNSAAYNSTIRLLASFTLRHQLLESVTQKAENFHDACILGAVWLRQRGFSSDSNQGGFGLEEWSLLCALLLESGGHQGRPLFSPRYSAVQLFKAILQVLSSRDMYDPFVLRGDAKVEAIDQPIFFDAVSGVNILYKMCPWSYAKLRQYARHSLAVVNSKTISGFDSAFISKISGPVLEFDEAYTIDFAQGTEDKLGIMTRLYEVLKKGLGDRVLLIDLQASSQASWKITASMPSDSLPSLSVGLLVNPDASSRLVDHGPSVEEKEESQQFREFWGDKAELRRFKDGRIEESLVWSAESPVTSQIIQYLVQRYFKLSTSAIKTSQTLSELQLSSSISAEESFAAVNAKFQSLSSTLHHLDGLPLPVRSVSAASELSRSSSLILPLEPGYVQPVDIMIQFDSSGRWPDDLRAIQYTKIAFLTKIGDLLSNQDRTLECRVGLENTSSSAVGTLNSSFLDIINPSPDPRLPPIIFRLRIHHDREIHLIQQAISSKAALPPPLRDSYQAALQLQKHAVARTLHTTNIRILITAFPPLSDTIRLLKQFFSVHHLSSHVLPEAIELLAAHTFLNPSSPWSTPGTSTSAFARTLYFLSRWDWASEPLLTDLSLNQDALPLSQRQDLETRFTAWRKLDPAMNSVAWFIGTNLDSTGVVWTQGTTHQDPTPPRVVAGRVTALARAAVEVMQQQHTSTSTSTSADTNTNRIMTAEDWAAIFTSSPLADFDFVIHLRNPSTISSNKPHNHKPGSSGKPSKFKNLEIASTLSLTQSLDNTGIDTVSAYLADLRSCFGAVALFFYGGSSNHNINGDIVIGGLWRPHLRTGTGAGAGLRPWKIRLGMSTVPVSMPVQGDEEQREGRDGEEKGKKQEELCRVNFEGMLAEMAMMGEGVVAQISVGGSKNGGIEDGDT